MGKAVVCTPNEAEGFSVKDGEHVVLGTAPRGFAWPAINLLRNREARRRIGVSPRESIEKSGS